MDSNKIFNKDFDNVCSEVKIIEENRISILKCISQIPPLTNLEICKNLEDEYWNLYEYTMLLANAYMKVSQLYHYVKLINEQALNDSLQ
jgi:hypothetical protein